MATKVDTKNLEKLFNDLVKNIKSPAQMKLLGGFAIKTIRERTRGKYQGVARPYGNRFRLKNVSEEWAERRIKETNRHPEAATGLKSNLTNKGTMLNSMVLKNVTNTGFFIGFRTQKEADKAEGNEARGRPFLYLGKVEVRDAATFLKKNILKGI